MPRWITRHGSKRTTFQYRDPSGRAVRDARALDRIEADPDCVLREEPVLGSAEKAAILEATAAATGFVLPRELAAVPAGYDG